MAANTWNKREVPILEALSAAEEAGEHLDDSRDLADITGLDQKQVSLALEALRDEKYIDGVDVTTMDDDGLRLRMVKLLGPGRRAVGAWPAEDADFGAFLTLLTERIDATDDEEEKTRLRRFLDAARGVSGQVGTQLLVAWAKQQAGL